MFPVDDPPDLESGLSSTSLLYIGANGATLCFGMVNLGSQRRNCYVISMEMLVRLNILAACLGHPYNAVIR